MNKLPIALRIPVIAMILGLAVLTGIISWGHGHHASIYFGENTFSTLLPFVPDVAMLVSIVIRMTDPTNKWAKIGMVSGIIFTIWMNIMNVTVFPGEWYRTVGSAILSLMPPFFLFLCIEMFFSIGTIIEKVKASKAEALAAEAQRVQAIAAEQAARLKAEADAKVAADAAQAAEVARLAQVAAERILAEKAEAEALKAEAELSPQAKGWIKRRERAAASM